MIDEKLLIKKLELLKETSKEIMGDHLYMKHGHLAYFLDLLIKYINSMNVE